MTSGPTLDSFQRQEEGGVTAFGLTLLVGSLALGGLSFDIAYAYKARTELQVAADTAAHAALYARQDFSLTDSRDMAVEMARRTLPPSAFGEVLRAEDIQFGTWDQDAQSFTVDNTTRDTVMVNTERLRVHQNEVPAFLLSFVGLDAWDVRTGAVFETYYPTCFREGFVAELTVDLQSNNGFYNGFCLHANGHVEINSNNFFETGVVVSMPDKNDLVLPNSGYESNEGLADALREQKWNFRVLNRLDEIMDELWNGDLHALPDYIQGSMPIQITGKKVDASDFTPNRVHIVDCGNSGNLTVEPGTTLKEVVVLTHCAVSFGQGVALEDVLLATTDTSANSVTSASGLQVGRDDNCLTGGGAQILTRGGMDFPADLKMFGGQLIARSDIEFAANADGIEGASMVSGGRIDGTSNMTMGFCGDGMEDNVELPYFRLAG